MQSSEVKVWVEQVMIPTYKVFPPEKSPFFIEKRAYQGSTGKVYPLPIIEKISDTKEDVSYKAIYLENKYLKVMILPELGGRIQRAFDKTNQYDFVYYNHVIKPALVGLTGPWISGGIEFNWPQHHRPSTFSPIDYTYSENSDGSCSVYVSEIDKMYGTKGMASFTLYPETAYIEIKGQLFNRTDIPQTFLWWANPAVPVNDNTFSVFPPDVHAVMDHGKRAVSTFPIATGEYYKYDYSEGIDISMYKNIKVPTSYMAAHSDYDFIGNYDTGIHAGLLHVADHHISPGKKQWTWGNGDFGQCWDRNLTDTDGPYIELMTGVFTDNQPDFTWLKPYEEKSFTQYFMPYKKVGRVKNATKNAMIGFDVQNKTAYIKVYTSKAFENAIIRIMKKDVLLFESTANVSPTEVFEADFPVEFDSAAGCNIYVYDAKGKELVSYASIEETIKPTPEPADPLPAPEDLKSTEELYLAATHLEQYRHATYEPADYYEEGLKRDSSDIRLNNGYGLLQYRRGSFEQSIFLLNRAIKKLTWKNPNPYHGETYFNLGLAYFATGNYKKSFDSFYKSTWSSETQSGGFYWLACLASRNYQFQEALEFVNKSLIRNWHHLKARTLKAALLRILGIDNSEFIKESLIIDPLDMGSLYELSKQTHISEEWIFAMKDDVNNYLEYSLDYIKFGFYEDALNILKFCPKEHPMIFYYQGYIYSLQNRVADAKVFYNKGETACPDYCFPNKIEEILILEDAIKILSRAPFASYYLGNLYYDKKQYEKAIKYWEKSIQENPSYAITYRNLAIAYYNKEEDPLKALTYIENALNLDENNSRFLLEYDQLLSRLGTPLERRLSMLEQNISLVKDKDALYIEYISLLNNTDQFEKALECLSNHIFHPWEGGEGKVSNQYRYALTEKALILMEEMKYQEALDLLDATLTYPKNLGEGKLPNVQDNIAYYYMGKIYQCLDKNENAIEYFQKASIGLEEPASVLYYNDQPSDTILYQGLAHLELGNLQAAKKSFHQLLSFGQKHLFDRVDYDYFAVSLPEIEVFPIDIQLRNETYCKYLIALGNIGLGNYEKAKSELNEILKKDPGYQYAIRDLKMISRMVSSDS